MQLAAPASISGLCMGVAQLDRHIVPIDCAVTELSGVQDVQKYRALQCCCKGRPVLRLTDVTGAS